MSDENARDEQHQDMLQMVTDIVSAYVSYNTISSGDIPELVRTVHTSLQGVQSPNAAEEKEQVQKPAVPVRRSVQPDYLICLEDGKKLKMLKRYLRTQYDISPEEYRRKWNLPSDYPMVAPNYSAQRSNFAKSIGLGRRRG